MFSTLPKATVEIGDWTWAHIQAYYDDLLGRELTAETVDAWLAGWSELLELLFETKNRLYVAVTCDTQDQRIAALNQKFLDEFYEPSLAANQQLKEKLLESELVPAGFEIPLRNMRAESDLFRQANVPLLAEEIKLSEEYDRIVGAQTVEWEGHEVTIAQLQPVYMEQDRTRREAAWKLAAARQMQDRAVLNDLWKRLLELRKTLAVNADYASYRDYRWKQLLRFDYTPASCRRFHDAIEEVVVPEAIKLYEDRRQKLGLDSLRPWDLDVDTANRPPLRPFTGVAELREKTYGIFQRVDPKLAEYYDIMRTENLLDLPNRKGKAPGGYCIDYPQVGRPFIFMNSVGIHEDVLTLLHEGGHGFHVFESAGLPYYHQMQISSEIAEVASMTMELLSAPYLLASEGGFYSDEDYRRARREHLESILRFWPYMAVVDAFQLWAYENQDAAADPSACDQSWKDLWTRFMPGIDVSGLADWLVTGWHRKLHIFQDPFYYVEYGMAQLGAIQIWRNSLTDRPGAIAAYRQALSLGGTRSLPELFKAAGARFAFDKATLQSAVSLLLQTLETL